MSSITANDCEFASAPVRMTAPTGINAAKPAVARLNVTKPEAATAGNLVSPKSPIQLSKSAPLLVAARVSDNTSKINHCIHNATEALASRMARNTLPTETSNKVAQEAVTTAA
jgi:hypothetical protein